MLKKLLILSVLCACVLCFTACGGQGESVMTDDEVSGISVSDSFTDSVSTLINDYFDALKTHDHKKILEITTEDFQWNYDQTDFENSVKYITNTSVDEMEFGKVQNEGKAYTVPVKYTLEYSEENSNGKYSYYDYFIIQENDGIYKISAVLHKGEG
ncbi:MAG: hypothetical protein PUG48_04225 [Clostridia bacterium]|nr:hypothetical protein [Clostridia bacterium]